MQAGVNCGIGDIGQGKETPRMNLGAKHKTDCHVPIYRDSQ